jgi:PAS domain S-box-containing protein
MASLKEILRPPIFPNDEEASRTARRLNAILLIASVLLTLLIGVLLMRDNMKLQPSTTILSSLVLLMVGLLVILRRGYVQVATYTFLIASWLCLTYVAWLSEGIRDSAYTALFIIILAAGLLKGWRAATFVTGLSVVAGWVLAYGEMQGLVLPVLDSAPTQAAEMTFVLTIAGSIIYLIINSLQQSVQQARQSNHELAALSAQLEDRVAARTRDLNLAAEIGREVSQVHDMNFLLPLAAELIYKAFDLYQVQVYLLDEAQNNLVLRASIGYAGSQLLAAGHQLPLNKTSINVTAVIQKQPVIVADTTQNARFQPNPLLPDTRSEMVVPLMVEQEVFGVLDLQSNRPNALTEENLSAFTVLAGQLSIAILNENKNQQTRQALQEVQQSQQFLSSLIETIPNPIFYKDTTGAYRGFNQAFLDYLGQPANALLGKTVFDLQTDQTLAAKYHAMDTALFENPVQSQVYESLVIYADGTPHNVIFNKNAYRNPDGSVGGLVGVIIDISDQKQAEARLTKQAQDLQAVAEVSTRVAAAQDEMQLLQDMLDLTKERFGLYHAHIYAVAPFGEEMALVAGAGDTGRQMVTEGWTIALDQEQSLVARAARTLHGVIVNDVASDPGFLPHPLLPKTRSEMAVPMIAGEQLVGVLDLQADTPNFFTAQDVQIQTMLAAQTAVALQNVRQYQQTQEALTEANTFRQIAQATSQGIGLASMTGNVIYMNPALINLLGLDDLSDVRGRDISQFYDPEQAAYVLNEVIPIVMAEGVWTGEVVVQQPDGQTIPTIHSIFLVRDENGRPLFLGNNVINITDRKKAEEAQQQLATALESEQRTLQAIFQSLPAGIFVAEAPTGRPLLANNLATDILGRGLAPDANQNELAKVYDAYLYGTDTLYPTEQLPLVRAMFGAHSTVDDMEIRRPDGQRILLEVTGAPISGPDGQITAAIIIFQDITERKQTELTRNQLTQELEERLEQVNALQRAMTRQGWEAFLTATERPLQGFMLTGNELQPIHTSLNEAIPQATINLAELTEPSMHPSQTMMAMPLQIHGESIGVMGARSATGETLSEEQYALMAALTGQVAEALERARLFEETELGRQRLDVQARELAVINEVAQSVSQLLEPADLLETIFKQVQRALLADAFIVATYDARSEMLTYPLVYDERQRFQPPPAYPSTDNPWMQVVQTGQPRLLNRTPEEVAERLADLADAPEQRLGQPGKVSASLIFVPLFLGQKTIGAMSVQSYAHAAYDERDVALLTGIANHVAVALENARLYTETQRRAEREALVNTITQKIQSTLTVENALETAVTELGRVFQSPYAAIEIALSGQQNGRVNPINSKE